MKRLLVFFLIVAFSMCSIMATHAEAISHEPIEMVDIGDGIETRTVHEDWDQAVKYIYRTVKLIYENDPNDPEDDAVITIQPAVAKITYAFCGTWSSISESYTGGSVKINGDWPKYEVIRDTDIGR